MNTTAVKTDPLMGWMESLGDSKRLRLLRLLERRELGVAELCDILQQPQSTISRHLKLLAEKRWIRSRRHGTAHLYQMVLDELDPAARRLWLLARERTESWNDARQDALRLEHCLNQRQSRGERFFAESADHWDGLRAELYGRLFIESAIASLLPSEMVIADLGCGTGAMAEVLSRRVRKVIGVDHSPEMLKAARRRTASRSNVELRRGELRGIPIEDAACDAAMLILVLTYVPDIASALRETARILKPNGTVVIVDLLPHERVDFQRRMGQVAPGLDQEQLKAGMQEAGLQAETRALPPEPNVKGPALFLATGIKMAGMH